MSGAHSILIAGIGNIFLGDDAFGVEVVKRLLQRPIPDSVHVEDFGIRGFDLTYALMEEHYAVVLIDAMPRGGEPGTLYVVEPDTSESIGQEMALEPHGMNPMNVLQMATAMGGQPRRVLIVGCEPATFGPEEGAMGLSEPVQRAVGEAVTLVENLIGRIRSNLSSLAEAQL
ncbi:MAG: hydrogenase maturation protease [Nitrospira sp. SG-bin1]|nr:MAG: hydrogenase maturation protease [Nitrospira sp. SG-bin1]